MEGKSCKQQREDATVYEEFLDLVSLIGHNAWCWISKKERERLMSRYYELTKTEEVKSVHGSYQTREELEEALREYKVSGEV